MLEGVYVHARASKYIDVRLYLLQVKMAQVKLIHVISAQVIITQIGK